MGNSQPGWICTISCYTDTIVSAVAMFWAAATPAEEDWGKSNNPTIVVQFPYTNDLVDGILSEVESAPQNNELDCNVSLWRVLLLLRNVLTPLSDFPAKFAQLSIHQHWLGR